MSQSKVRSAHSRCSSQLVHNEIKRYLELRFLIAIGIEVDRPPHLLTHAIALRGRIIRAELMYVEAVSRQMACENRSKPRQFSIDKINQPMDCSCRHFIALCVAHTRMRARAIRRISSYYAGIVTTRNLLRHSVAYMLLVVV